MLQGIYYLYELRLQNDESITPHTNAGDGEVDAFWLMDVEEVMQGLPEGQFKPSSAMASRKLITLYFNMQMSFVRYGLS